MQKRILITVALTSIITACGGGGGGSTPPNGGTVGQPPKISSSSAASQDSVSISLEKSEVSMPESSSIEVAVNTDGSNNVTYTVESSDPALSGSVTNGSLQITSANVDLPTDAVLTITANKGSATDSANLTVHIDNTSAKEVIEQANMLITQKGSLGLLAEETTVFEFVSDLAFKSAHATRSETKAYAADFAALTAIASSEIIAAIDQLSLTLEAYNHATSTESQLKSDYDNAMGALDKNGKLALEKINVAINLSRMPAVIASTGYVFSESVGKFSQFFGNPTLGNVDDSQWKFNTTHDYLNGLLNSTSCPAQ